MKEKIEQFAGKDTNITRQYEEAHKKPSRNNDKIIKTETRHDCLLHSVGNASREAIYANCIENKYFIPLCQF